jgi:hypothetical protein
MAAARRSHYSSRWTIIDAVDVSHNFAAGELKLISIISTSNRANNRQVSLTKQGPALPASQFFNFRKFLLTAQPKELSLGKAPNAPPGSDVG